MDNYIITIARGFGSGGKTIGEELGQKLGVRVYNQEILDMAAERSGINEELFRLADEHVKKKGKKNRPMYEGRLIPPSDKEFVSRLNMFNYQAKVMVNLAQTESCIIIGRAADYILRYFTNVVSVNIQAPLDACIAEVMDRYRMTEEEARREIITTDKKRQDFYAYYTGQTWGDPKNYDLSLNSARLGRDKCADAIIEFAERKLGKKLR